ncbi:MAG: TVP38/TMEM64 family protein [Phormidesmis sp.]
MFGKLFGGRKFWLFFMAAALLTVGGSLVGWRSLALLFDHESLVEFFSRTDEQSSVNAALGVGLFLVAHVVANAIGIPGTVLVVVGGAVYGLWWGALCSVVGATMGAVVAFWLARYLLHDWFQKRFSHSALLKKLNKMLCKEGLSCILLVRFSPISPFNVVNFALGLTPVSVRSYALGTLIGIIPGTLAYTWLGVTGSEAIASGNWLPLCCCLLLLMLLSSMPIVIRQRSSKARQRR